MFTKCIKKNVCKNRFSPRELMPAPDSEMSFKSLTIELESESESEPEPEPESNLTDALGCCFC